MRIADHLRTICTSRVGEGGDVTYDEQLSDGGAAGEHRQTEEDGGKRGRGELGTNEYEFSQLWLY